MTTPEDEQQRLIAEAMTLAAEQAARLAAEQAARLEREANKVVNQIKKWF